MQKVVQYIIMFYYLHKRNLPLVKGPYSSKQKVKGLSLSKFS